VRYQIFYITLHYIKIDLPSVDYILYNISVQTEIDQSLPVLTWMLYCFVILQTKAQILKHVTVTQHIVNNNITTMM